MLAGIIIILVASGGKKKSVMGIRCGTQAYWWILAISFPFLTISTVIVAFYLRRKDSEKERIGFPFHHTDTRWTTKNLILFPVLAFVVGLVAGFFGIGGGVLQAPLMLELGVIPWVTSATSQFIVLITSISAVAQNLSNGNLEWRWTLWFMFFNAIGALIGKQMVDRIVRHFKLQSLIVFFLAGLIVLTAAALVQTGIRRIVLHLSSWGIKQYCSNITVAKKINRTLLNHTLNLTMNHTF